MVLEPFCTLINHSLLSSHVFNMQSSQPGTLLGRGRDVAQEDVAPVDAAAVGKDARVRSKSSDKLENATVRRSD